MSPAYFFEAVKQRYVVLAASVLALVLMAVMVNIFLPKKYESTVSLVLNYKGIDPVTGNAFSALLMPGYMATQIDIIESKNVAMKVVHRLNLFEHEYYFARYDQENPDKRVFGEWIAEQLLKKLKVKPSRESGVISISIKLPDAPLAAAVANGFAEEYQKTVTELKEEPLRKVSAYLRDRITESRARLESSQTMLSDYQSQKGVTNGESSADYETARLNELSTQLVLSQVQTMEAGSRNRQAQGGTEQQVPEILSSPLIQNIKGMLAQAEARLAQARQQLTPDHPLYQKTKAEVDALRNELNQHVRTATNGVATNVRINEKREQELREALAAQVNKVMELNKSRHEIALMVKDIQSEHRAYDMAVERFNQANLEGQANQSDISILNMATPASEPSSPMALLNIVGALLFGTVIGLVLILMLEIRNRKIRTLDDLAFALSGPVIERVPSRPRRLSGPNTGNTNAIQIGYRL